MTQKELQIYSKVRFREIKPKIIENVILENQELNVQDFWEMAEANEILCQNQPFCLLLEFKPLASVSKEFLEIAKTHGKTDELIATAMIVNNMAHKIAGNIYLKVNKPSNLTKLFSSRKKAIDWLIECQLAHQIKINSCQDL